MANITVSSAGTVHVVVASGGMWYTMVSHTSLNTSVHSMVIIHCYQTSFHRIYCVGIYINDGSVDYGIQVINGLKHMARGMEL